MKNYKVALHRDYIVDIKAKNEEEAKFLAEFFVGGERIAPTKRKESITSLTLRKLKW